MTEFLRSRLFELYAAFAAGRIDDALRDFDDKVVMTSYAPIEVFPSLGRRQGKAAVAATMRAMHADFEHLSYAPVFMVTETAAVILLARLRQRATDRIIQLFVAHFLRLQNGRIIELREFMDSFDAVQQVLGREIAISQEPH